VQERNGLALAPPCLGLQTTDYWNWRCFLLSYCVLDLLCVYCFVQLTIIKNLYVFSVLSGSPKWNVMAILHNVYQRCMTILFGDDNENLLFLDTCVFLSSFTLHVLAKYYFNILITVTGGPVKYFF